MPMNSISMPLPAASRSAFSHNRSRNGPAKRGQSKIRTLRSYKYEVIPPA